MDFMDLTGIETLEKDVGYAKLSLNIGPKCLNYYGYVHGGVYFTLSDSAAGASTQNYEGTFITLNSSINYLSSTKEGKLVAIAEVINKTRKLAVIKVNTYVGGLHCTQSTFTMYKVE